MVINYRDLISKNNSALSQGSVIHQCVGCKKIYAHAFINICKECGYLIDVFYPYHLAKIYSSTNSLEKYADLIPIINKENFMWGGEGNTPCYRVKNLEKLLGHNCLYIKDETRNPTLSTKDRMASIILSYFKELGIKEVALNSTGNSSTAIARAVILHRTLKINIFVGKMWLSRLNYQDDTLINTYILDNDFALCELKALTYAQKNNITYEASFFNPGRREGLKLTYLEAFDQMAHPPEFVFQAVSSGMGLLGAYKGALEYIQMGRLQKLPKFMPVQQESCSPMVNAYQAKANEITNDYIVHNPTGIAEAILLGNPSKSYRYIRHIVNDSEGDMLSVTKQEICEAKEFLLKEENIMVCHAAAAAMAGAIKSIRNKTIGPHQPVLVNLTGRERPINPIPKNTQICDIEISPEILAQFKK